MTPLTQPPAWLIHKLTHNDTHDDPAPTPPGPNYQTITPGQGERPGDQWAAETTWDQILQDDGWTHHHTDRNGEKHWTRPGKPTRDGTSATTGHTANNNLNIFTTSMTHAGLQAEETYTKLGYYAATRHSGDHRAAARALSDAGYGTTSPNGTTSSSQAQQAAKAAADPQQPWPQPIPLDNLTDLPAFPLHTLPTWITDHITETADDLQIPADLPATLALGVLSTLASGRIDINVHGHWNEDVNLYLVIAMPPSTGKSPAFKAMTRPVQELEEEHARNIRAACSTNAAVVTNLEAKIKRLVQSDSMDHTELTDLHEQLFIAQEQPTKPPKLTAGDATPEALEKMLADNGGRIAIHSTEGGVFGMMTGRYSDSNANLDVYLQGWSGDKIDTQRIGREGVTVPKALLTMLLTVQPTVIAALSERPELAGRGLTARFMYAVPTDTLGGRDLQFYDPEPTAARTNYDNHLLDIGRHMFGWLVPIRLTIDWNARTLFSDWRQALEARRTPDGDLRPLAEWTGKLESSVTRVAALLHIAHGHDHTETVDRITMSRAIEIGDYWLAHAQHVHDVWGTDQVQRDARKILDWIRRKGEATFTPRDIQRGNKTLTADEILTALELLQEYGWIATDHPGPIRRAKGKTTTLIAHPDLTGLRDTLPEGEPVIPSHPLDDF